MLGQNFNAPLPLGIFIGIISLSLFSMFLGWTIQKTNSIIFPTLIHFSIKSNSITLLATIILIVVAILTWDKIKIGKTISKNNVS